LGIIIIVCGEVYPERVKNKVINRVIHIVHMEVEKHQRMSSK